MTAFYVEVTVAACILDGDGYALGDNMVDTTLGFGMNASSPPPDVTDERVNASLAHHVSPVLAAISAILTEQLGFVAAGVIDEPMTEHSKPTGEMGKSTPVRVVLVPEAPGGKAQA